MFEGWYQFILLACFERAHCQMQGGKGTRIIPDGTIFGAHFIQTPDYIQITG